MFEPLLDFRIKTNLDSHKELLVIFEMTVSQVLHWSNTAKRDDKGK